MNDQNTTDVPRARLSIAGRDPVEMVGAITFGRDPRPTTARARTVEISGDPLVSKSHFAVDVDEASGGVVITDLGSSNGTFIHSPAGETVVPNGQWIPLPDGAEVEFGDQRMQVALLAASEHPEASSDATAMASGGGDRTPVNAVSPIAPADPWGAAASASEPTPEPDIADQASIECSSCARDLPADARFCDECGTPTAEGSAAAPSPVAPPSTAALWGDAPAEPVAPSGPPAAPPVAPPSVAQPPSPVVQPLAGHGGPPPGAPAPLGAPTFVDPGAPESTSSGAGKKVAIGVGVVVLLGAAIFGATQLLGGGDESSASTAPRLPETIDEQWSESVDGVPVSALVGRDAVFVANTDGEVVSLDRSDGDELWSERVGEGGFGLSIDAEFDDVVVLTVCSLGCDMIGLDRTSADELWREEVDEFAQISQVGDRLFVTDSEQIALFDPSSGDRLERVRSEFSIPAEDHLLVLDGDDLEVFDLDLEPIYGPVELPEFATAAAYDGEHVHFAVDGELLTIDTDGDTVREMSFGVDDIDAVFVVGSDNVIVSTDEGVLSVTPTDGRADERWTQDGVAELLIDVDGGPVIIVSDLDSDDATVYDADTGDRRFVIDDYSNFLFTVVAAQNGLYVSDRTDADDRDFGSAETVAFDWSNGDELWDETFDGLVVVDREALVAIEDDGDVTFFE